ncbi:UPF0489 family protein [Myxococcota bacterium]|nr:UPF0489 family protein [Myxococcota bacterium]
MFWRTDDGPRPSGRAHRADGDEAVRTFAEDQCRLDLRAPCAGSAFEHDDGTFDALAALIARGALVPPFELVHVDAHADLGVGEHDHSFARISGDLLHRPVATRSTGVRSGFGALSFGNWLAYALACRWIDRLTIVRHPKAGDDLHAGYFTEYVQPEWQRPPARRELSLRMQPLTPAELESGAWRRTGRWGHVLDTPVEAPLIPTTIVARDALALDHAPDFLLLCQSPGYSPRSADRIFRNLRKYLRR